MKLIQGHDWVRFFSRVEQTDNCWLWRGCCNPNGYGTFSSNGRMRLAHRWLYIALNGPLPAQTTDLDHLCRTPSCVNPMHLEPVTHAENMGRGRNAQVTHCPADHKYTPENTRIDRKGRRVCRACHRLRERARRTQTVEGDAHVS